MQFQQLFIISVPCNEGSVFMTVLTALWVDNLIISFPEFHVLVLNSWVQISLDFHKTDL